MTICAAKKGACVHCSVGSWVRVCMCAHESACACVQVCSVQACMCVCAVCPCVQCAMYVCVQSIVCAGVCVCSV